MAENSSIEWCDHTFNPWTGCTKVSPGCEHCYAEAWAKRSGIVTWGKGQPRRLTTRQNWNLPSKWDHEAAAAEARIRSDIGNASEYMEVDYHRPRVFCASLADWLDPEVPADWLRRLLDLIRQTPHLDWLLLTKRPELFHARLDAVMQGFAANHCSISQAALAAWIGNMRRGWDGVSYCASGRENYWIGTTIEDQLRAMQRIPALLRIPATTRFLSCEPLLELVQLPTLSGIQWVIVGGESGNGARPFDPDWARELRDQCHRAGTAAFFMKQMGGPRRPFAPIPDDLRIQHFPS